MITKAIEKTTSEVNKLKGRTAQHLGEYLIDHVAEQKVEKVLADA